jgi:hypothetical protein
LILTILLDKAWFLFLRTLAKARRRTVPQAWLADPEQAFPTQGTSRLATRLKCAILWARPAGNWSVSPATTSHI